MSALPSYTQNGQTITFAFAQPLQLTIVTPEISFNDSPRFRTAS